MTTNITIVMYHYVREIKNSNYPQIKGLEIKDFINQLILLKQKYEIISGDLLIAYLKGEEKKLPENSCLLTFDDGYKDHFNYVLPELIKKKITGCFFPVSAAVEENKLLDVNSIQFILEKSKNINNLLIELEIEMIKAGIEKYQINNLYNNINKDSKYDSKKIILFKRILQRDLSINTRKSIIAKLFKKYVGKNEEEFSSNLYMSEENLKAIINEDMYIGNHSHNHFWLESIDKTLQEKEILKSIKFLLKIGANVNNWIMCYPYGSYNNDTITILKKNNCIAGLAIKEGIATLSKKNNFELKRFDTNHFL